ncbi:hypothetical protein AX769_20270 [Frondihabitans sp. PAMC 28766]|uniref:hypothetical protein n=1 Tax=Frondihabitans sp. PAMC 28766 TaxID=1795630 RepID=UPI00078C8448|nr:hypothetical protein [Frondihabitans sp. PAMC 28766]AMM22056.1 hypothetical protein AX769_20270 [Frondihabitans sp. PAMC 28766]
MLDLQAANHWATFVGTADTVADEIERWYRSGGADGFNLFLQYPADFERFRSEVIPRLQDRGVYRTEYEGDTLRANLELRVPVNRQSPVNRHGPAHI